MQSTLKSMLLVAAVAISALAGTQAATAGGFRHGHFNNYLLGGWGDTAGAYDADDDYYGSYTRSYRYGSAAEDVIDTATGIASGALGVDADDLIDALEE